MPSVVSYLASTSNHNCDEMFVYDWLVVSYLASTSNHNVASLLHPQIPLFLILHLHQTTTVYRFSVEPKELFLILHLHQTTTLGQILRCRQRCFLSCIYIKPQPTRSCQIPYYVVSYLASTSNHNNCVCHYLSL